MHPTIYGSYCTVVRTEMGTGQFKIRFLVRRRLHIEKYWNVIPSNVIPSCTFTLKENFCRCPTIIIEKTTRIWHPSKPISNAPALVWVESSLTRKNAGLNKSCKIWNTLPKLLLVTLFSHGYSSEQLLQFSQCCEAAACRLSNTPSNNNDYDASFFKNTNQGTLYSTQTSNPSVL